MRCLPSQTPTCMHTSHAHKQCLACEDTNTHSKPPPPPPPIPLSLLSNVSASLGLLQHSSPTCGRRHRPLLALIRKASRNAGTDCSDTQFSKSGKYHRRSWQRWLGGTVTAEHRPACTITVHYMLPDTASVQQRPQQLSACLPQTEEKPCATGADCVQCMQRLKLHACISLHSGSLCAKTGD